MNRHFLDDLNAAQREAATQIEGPLLILAGAGSGKTKTITTRLAYLIEEVGIPPSNTLTLTFTNKAAAEMRERALRLVQRRDMHPPLLCTFHKFGLLFLKFHIQRLGRKPNFVLIDGDDRKKILKNINDDLPVGLVESEISRMKNWLIMPDEALLSAQDKNYKLIASIYGKYEEFLKEKNMVDFDDLLLLSLKILEGDEELAKEVSEKYQYIMVDEYQDTNELQYKLLKKLCQTHNNLCVVGDDDQSIYGWRGANINHILDFPDHFAGAKVVRLEENYRSTAPILEAANSLIEFNKGRLGKTLKSVKGAGEAIEILESLDEGEEAQKVAKRIRTLLDSGVSPSDIAVLFRLNALSRSLEEGFNRAKIPFKLVGAMRFYERSEIKDILSYFRLIVNPHDDFSLARIINKPKRGIGKVTQDKLLLEAQRAGCSLFELYKKGTIEGLVSAKNHETLTGFFAMIEELQAVLEESTLRFLERFEELSLLKEYFENSKETIDRVSNIEEFYGVFRDFILSNPMANLEDFLNDLSLKSDQDEVGDSFVSCMSVHASKGLEFEHLFVVGFEEGFFPMIREGSDLEEERRLGYVAFTRAKSHLAVSHVHSRFYKGKRTELLKSRFLKEAGLLEGSLVIEKRSNFKKGDLVTHKIFGAGRVSEVSGVGKEYKLKINFGGMVREILSSYVIKI
ncbi:MAG: UvrD-helicase domain-containing protein [Wolinella succinogenes]|uniref:ATP-dependent helicase n=1 Tax=Wolinella succinogenes TaxID=844 RepID=UPI0016B47D15|nr:UvrD-helicase domain-containing protein [Wolinella succinogenes]NLU35234.1 UvrD-helicase domain-containing protein [Wolinella succinogenes]